MNAGFVAPYIRGGDTGSVNMLVSDAQPRSTSSLTIDYFMLERPKEESN